MTTSSQLELYEQNFSSRGSPLRGRHFFRGGDIFNWANPGFFFASLLLLFVLGKNNIFAEKTVKRLLRDSNSNRQSMSIVGVGIVVNSLLI